MKLKRSQLKELVRETIKNLNEVETVKFKDPETGKDHEITMDTARQYKSDIDKGDKSKEKAAAVKAAGLDKDDKGDAGAEEKPEPKKTKISTDPFSKGKDSSDYTIDEPDKGDKYYQDKYGAPDELPDETGETPGDEEKYYQDKYGAPDELPDDHPDSPPEDMSEEEWNANGLMSYITNANQGHKDFPEEAQQQLDDLKSELEDTYPDFNPEDVKDIEKRAMKIVKGHSKGGEFTPEGMSAAKWENRKKKLGKLVQGLKDAPRKTLKSAVYMLYGGPFWDQLTDGEGFGTDTYFAGDFKKNESVHESKLKRTTVREVQQWMKKLEENRYKKVYNSDCRRVAWMVNNIGENLENMPKTIRKKWTKAQYGRERYLAKEFVKHLKSKELTENNIRKVVRKTIGNITEGGKMIQLQIPIKDKLKVDKILKKSGGKIGKNYDIGVGKTGTFVLELDRKLENKILELMIKNRVQVREI